MNLTKEQAQQEIAKVHEDLDLYCSTKYPIQTHYRDLSDELNEMEFAYWIGGYNYQNPLAVGDDFFGEYPEYIVTIDDLKGEAIQFGYYTGHYYIKKENGKYVVIGKTTETKRPW